MLKNNLKEYSSNDLEARLVKSRDGFMAGYNVQSIVDKKHHMAALAIVTNDQFDSASLAVMIEKLYDEYGQYPGIVIADKGYFDFANIKKVEKKVNLNVSVPRSPENKKQVSFSYDKQKDEVICQAGRRLKLVRKNVKRRKRLGSQYKSKDCSGCKLKPQCTSAENRTYTRYEDEEQLEQFKAKMKTPEARMLLALRKSIAEHPHGTYKINMGKTPLLLRGKLNGQTEVTLYNMTYNIKRLINIEDFSCLINKAKNFCWKAA